MKKQPSNYLSLKWFPDLENRFIETGSFDDFMTLVKRRAEEESRLPSENICSLYDNKYILALFRYLTEHPLEMPPKELLDPFHQNEEEKKSHILRVYIRFYELDIKDETSLFELMKTVSKVNVPYTQCLIDTVKADGKEYPKALYVPYAGICYGSDSSPKVGLFQ